MSLSHQGIDWVVLLEDGVEVFVRLTEPLPLDYWAGMGMEVVATALGPLSTFPTLLESVAIWLAIAESWVENVSDIRVHLLDRRTVASSACWQLDRKRGFDLGCSS